MDFGRQVGVEIRSKIDPKRHRKSDEKKKVNLGRLGRVLGRFKRQKRSAVSIFRSQKGSAVPYPQLSLAAGKTPISLKKGTLHAENLQTLYRSPASGPRHAAGRLRARCGSKAQQSCVSATALEQKIMRGLSIRINQKSRKKMIKKRSKHRPETYQIAMQNRPNIDRKSIEHRSTIDQK